MDEVKSELLALQEEVFVSRMAETQLHKHQLSIAKLVTHVQETKIKEDKELTSRQIRFEDLPSWATKQEKDNFILMLLESYCYKSWAYRH